MKSNPTVKSYFYTVYGSGSFLRDGIYNLILAISFIPQTIVSVLFRRNLGERYFSFSTTLLMLLGMTIPVLIGMGNPNAWRHVTGFNPFNITSLLFLVFLGYQAYKRRQEFDTTSEEISCNRFSYYDGKNDSKIWNFLTAKMPFLLQNGNMRRVRMYSEPLVLIMAGLSLMVLIYTIATGFLLLVCGILQIWRVKAQYQRGRDYMLDKVDEIIADEEMANVLLENRLPEDARGFGLFSPVPIDEQMKAKVVDRAKTINEEEPVFAM